LTGNSDLKVAGIDSKQSKTAKHLQGVARPLRMLFTQPIIQFLAVYMAYVYGLMYLVLSTFPNLWSKVYHESTAIGSLNYIALGLGFFLGSQVAPRLNDRIYTHLQSRNGGIGKPEYRLLPIVLGR
jgi:predicted MFS family arabinose efflux permease